MNFRHFYPISFCHPHTHTPFLSSKFSPCFHIFFGHLTQLSLIRFACMHMGGVLYWSMAVKSVDVPLKKMTPPSPITISCQQILRQVRGLKGSSPVRDQMLTGPISCSSCADNHNCYEVLSPTAVPYPEGIFLLHISPHPLTFTSFCPYFHNVPWAWW